MTLAELLATSPAERWRSLTAEQQERIGAKVIAWVFADLVVDDDGCDTTEEDREEAQGIADEASSGIGESVMAAFPAVNWRWPEGTRYLAFDRAGRVIGEMVDAEPINHNASMASRFVPTDPEREAGPVVDGLPSECLPEWVWHEIEAGGHWAAVPPVEMREAA